MFASAVYINIEKRGWGGGGGDVPGLSDVLLHFTGLVHYMTTHIINLAWKKKTGLTFSHFKFYINSKKLLF